MHNSREHYERDLDFGVTLLMIGVAFMTAAGVLGVASVWLEDPRWSTTAWIAGIASLFVGLGGLGATSLASQRIAHLNNRGKYYY